MVHYTEKFFEQQQVGWVGKAEMTKLLIVAEVE